MSQQYKGPLDYIDVAARIVEFRTKHPAGSLTRVGPDGALEPVQFLDFGGKTWVVYTAFAYRTPEDRFPGVGTAWEPVPGPTQFTRDSEVQNAETAAWGRAIVAALAADTKKGVASAEEVRNRQDNAAEAPQTQPVSEPPEAWRSLIADAPSLGTLTAIYNRANKEGWATTEVMDALSARKKVLTDAAA